MSRRMPLLDAVRAFEAAARIRLPWEGRRATAFRGLHGGIRTEMRA